MQEVTDMKKKLFVRSLLWLAALGGALSMGSCASFSGSVGENGIANVSTRTLENGDTEVTIIYTDEEKDPDVFIVKRGNKGEEGNGIKSFTSKSNSDGSITITISFTDDHYSDLTFTLPAAKSIANVNSEKDKDGNDVIVVTYSDGSKSDPILLPKGEKGEDGVGFSNFETNIEDDGSVTISITLTNSSTPIVFTIPAGKNGVGISDMEAERNSDGSYTINVSYSNGENQTLTLDGPNTWLSGIGKPSDTNGKNGDFYLDEQSKAIYKKENGAWIKLFDLNESNKEYTVTFNLNAAGDDAPAFVGTSDKVTLKSGTSFYSSKVTFPVAVRNNYVFGGWWNSPNPNVYTNTMFTDMTVVHCDVALYARWIVK